MQSDRLHEAELRRLHRVKQIARPMGAQMGPELVTFFKQSVQKRQGKMTRIAECLRALVPEMLLDHCALESFSRGTLGITVDSSSHLYELKQLLLAGLQQQILLACAGTGLKKISLRAGVV